MSVQSPSDAGTHTVSHQTVHHVGDLTADRKRPHFSWEGAGLSVSHHPRDWARIMHSGGTIYELTSPDAQFYNAAVEDGPREEVVSWAVDAGYLEAVTVHEVSWTDADGTGRRLLCYDAETAREEAEARECGSPVPTEGYALGPEGRAYWEQAFKQSPADAGPLQAEGLAPVWFAKEHGYDGVWWDEKHAPEQYSAPRGVIFQDALSAWSITETGEISR